MTASPALKEPSNDQIKRIREMSEMVCGDPDAVLAKVGYPTDRYTASRILGAIHKVRNMGLAATDSLDEITDGLDSPALHLEKDWENEDGEQDEDGDPVSRENAEKVKRSVAIDSRIHPPDGRTRVCDGCRERKPLNQFKPWGRGRKRTCIPCESGDPEPNFKKCSGCDDVKPIDEFSKDVSRADGYDYYCRKCKKEKNRETRERLKAQPRRTFTVALGDEAYLELVIVADLYSLTPEERQFVLDLTDSIQGHPGFEDGLDT